MQRDRDREREIEKVEQLSSNHRERERERERERDEYRMKGKRLILKTSFKNLFLTKRKWFVISSTMKRSWRYSVWITLPVLISW